MLLALVLVPPLLAAVALRRCRRERGGRWLLPARAARRTWSCVGAALVLDAARRRFGGWLVLDALGKLVLGVRRACSSSCCSVYALGYLAQRPERPNRIFVACLLLLFSAMMTLVIAVAPPGADVGGARGDARCASAPLLYFNRNPRSLEATWKYLLIGSVGIALALLGLVLPRLRGAARAGLAPSLLFEDLVRDAPRSRGRGCTRRSCCCSSATARRWGWRRCTPGSPTPTARRPGWSARCWPAGSTSCAFLAILRVFHICAAAGEAAFARELMVVIGLFSMAVAGVFMARQRDFKRMLAYSSVEHMGILVLGVGLGGAAVFGALLHLVNNGLTKGVLFLSAATSTAPTAARPSSRPAGRCGGCRSRASLFLLGFFAITGSPPFGPFVSEFTILDAAIGSGRYVVVALVPRAAGRHLHRHGRRRCWRWCRATRPPARSAAQARDVADRRARRPPSWCWCCCWASTCRRRSTRCCARRRSSGGAP